MAKNQTSAASVWRSGIARANRLEHSSLINEAVNKEIDIVSKGFNSRGRIRQSSIIVANKDPENHSLQALPVTKPVSFRINVVFEVFCVLGHGQGLYIDSGLKESRALPGYPIIHLKECLTRQKALGRT